MNPTLDHINKLYPFVIIAEMGSIYQASLKLHISQPSLSQSLKSLEEALGEELFIRSTRGVRLTAFGENYYEMAKDVLQKIENFKNQSATLSTRLRLISYDGISNLLAPDLIKVGHHLHLISENSGLVMLNRLNEETADLAVIADPPQMPGYEYEKLVRSPYGLYASPKLLRRKKNLSLESLKNETLISIDHATIASKGKNKSETRKKSLESFIEKSGLGENKRLVVDNALLALNLAMQGVGFALLVTGQVLPHIKLKQIQEIPLSPIKNPISSQLYLVHKLGKGQQLERAKTSIKKSFKQAIEDYYSLLN